jgi:hypothetical protein
MQRSNMDVSSVRGAKVPPVNDETIMVKHCSNMHVSSVRGPKLKGNFLFETSTHRFIVAFQMYPND